MPTSSLVNKEKVRTHNALLLGLWGSMCLLVSSWVLGTIPQVVQLQFQWIMTIRQFLPLTFFMVLLGIFGAILHVIGWARLATSIKNWDTASTKVIRRAAMLWTIPLFFSVPMFSNDVFAYLGQGRLMQAGYDPYNTGISVLGGWRSQGVSEIWSESVTPYGPLFLAIERIILTSTNDNIVLSLIAFKLLAVLGIGLCYYFIPKVAKQNGFNEAKAIWLTIANPLFSFAFMISAHNDSLMMGLLIGGIYFFQDKRHVLGLLFVSASIAIKPITILALPFLGIMWARQINPIPTAGLQIKIWAYTAAIGLIPVVIFGMLIGLYPGWVKAFTTPGQVFNFYAPVSYLSWATGAIELVFGGSGQVGPTIVKGFFSLITILLILRLIFMNSTHRTILQRMTIAFAVTVAFSPVVYGWYILWVVLLFAISVEHNDKYVLPLIYLSVFYSIAPFAEPMDVSVIVDGLGIIRITAIVAMILSCYWLIIKNESMQRLYRFERAQSRALEYTNRFEETKLPNPLSSAKVVRYD
ncbi:MAG: polyprenol phosphomannose-dependent alpha 1,6 mannosyltransferase MptB [Micrococcaceae bacterium]